MDINTATVHNFMIYMDLFNLIEFSAVMLGIGLIVGLVMGLCIKKRTHE